MKDYSLTIFKEQLRLYVKSIYHSIGFFVTNRRIMLMTDNAVICQSVGKSTPAFLINNAETIANRFTHSVLDVNHVLLSIFLASLKIMTAFDNNKSLVFSDNMASNFNDILLASKVSFHSFLIFSKRIMFLWGQTQNKRCKLPLSPYRPSWCPNTHKIGS